jgi:hypothetical protein
MMSGDRSVQVGAAVLGVGAAVVIARLAYVWTSPHSHFWDVWAVLGLVLGGLGLVIMVIGWVMPKQESEPHSQVQKGGARSTNLQAGLDIVIDLDNPRKG